MFMSRCSSSIIKYPRLKAWLPASKQTPFVRLSFLSSLEERIIQKGQFMKRIQESFLANRTKFLYFIAKISLAGILIGLAIYGICYAWSVGASKAEPETVTELYFEDYLHLPSKVIPKHRYFFQFTLHNMENKDMEYSYEVYADVGQGKFFTVFDGGTVFVKNNQYKTIQEEFTTTSAFPRSEIVVNVINKHQQIDFWVEEGEK